MELAIPILAMGGLYASSSNNSNKNIKKETFSNKTKLTNEIPANYPNVTNQELSRTSVNNYNNPNQRTDKYFQNNSPMKLIFIAMLDVVVDHYIFWMIII